MKSQDNEKLISNLKKKREISIHKHTGKMPYDDGDRDYSDTSPSTSRNAKQQPPEARKAARSNSPLGPLGKA